MLTRQHKVLRVESTYTPVFTVCILVVHYFVNIFLMLNSFYTNLLQCLVVILFFIISSRDIKVRMSLLVVMGLSLSFVVITLKPNLISLAIIAMIAAMFEREAPALSTFKLYSIVAVCLMAVTLFLYFVFDFHVQEDTTIWRNGVNNFRMALGFSHPNRAMMHWYIIVVSIIMIPVKRELMRSILLVAISYVLFYWTLSRTSFYAIVGLIVLVTICVKFSDKPIPRFISLCVPYVLVVLFVVSLLTLVMPYNASIDALFSGRFAMMRGYYGTYGLSMLSSTDIDGSIDSSYLNMLLDKGLMFSATFIFLFFTITKKSTVFTWRKLFCLLSCFAIAFTESVFFNIELSLLLLLILYAQPVAQSSVATLPKHKSFKYV